MDELKLIQFEPPQGNIPGGTITKTDLLWLVGEAKKKGRFKDHSQMEKVFPEKKPNAEQGAVSDGDKPSE